MAFRPLRLYLDTSDYAVMYKAGPGSSHEGVREYLLEKISNNEIEIGVSYQVVFEFLQSASALYRDDRMARARLLTALCGNNAFAFPGDLGAFPPFSRDGPWYPRDSFAKLDVNNLVQLFLKEIAKSPELPRSIRVVLKNPKHLRKWIRERGQLPATNWPLPFGRSLFESGHFEQYLLGKISREEANQTLRSDLTDFEVFYKTWHGYFGSGDPLSATANSFNASFEVCINEVSSALEHAEAIYDQAKSALRGLPPEEFAEGAGATLTNTVRDIKKMRAGYLSGEELIIKLPQLRELLGEESARVAVQIILAFYKEKRRVKSSDAIDFLHAFYLPHADIWRGDRSFSDLLVKHKVECSCRIVNSLDDLPSRLNAMLLNARLAS